MAEFTLQRLLARKKETAPVLARLLAAIHAPIGIEDAEGRLLLGESVDWPTGRYPVEANGQTLGWVTGGEQAEAIVSLLTHLACKEVEKKTLANEVLHLYREVNLIYTFSENLASLLDVHAVSRMALDQARQLIPATDGAVLLLNEATQTMRWVTGFGDGLSSHAGIKLNEGIIGSIAASRNAEIVNDVQNHPRYTTDGPLLCSLACAPLKINDQIRGVIALGNATPVSYTAGDLKLLNTLALQTATAVENALLFEKTVQAAKEREQLLALHKELEVASTIQKSIVPARFPPYPDRTDFDILAEMITAKEVGGDFYDFFLLDADRLGFVIGDVSGKGVPAALFMAVSRTLLKATALQGLPPERCIERVNRLLASESPANMFVTVFYGILDTRTGEVVYCNGGHNPPYLLRKAGRVEVLEVTGGLVLGVFDKAVYKPGRKRLRVGDTFLLYTDGITEAMDAEHNEFTEARLAGYLKRCRGRALGEVIQGVIEEVKRFGRGAPQADDMTILGLRYLGGGAGGS